MIRGNDFFLSSPFPLGEGWKVQRETKDSSARDPAALREADCHRCALPAVLSSCPTGLGSPEPHWDRESIAPRGRHRKLSLSRRRRGPPSSPAVENEERGGGGPRAGRFLPLLSEPRWDCRGLCGAALPLLGCGRVRRAAPGAAVPLAGPGGAAPRRGAELPAPTQPSPPLSPQPRNSVFVLKRRPSSSLRNGAERPQTQRPAAFRDASALQGRGGREEEGVGGRRVSPSFSRAQSESQP